MAHLRTVISEAITDADLEELARALLRQALAGETAAASLLLSYLCGKPTSAPNPDRLDAEELQAILDGPTQVDVLRAFMRLADITQAIDLLGKILDTQNLKDKLLDTTQNRNLLREMAEKK